MTDPIGTAFSTESRDTIRLVRPATAHTMIALVGNPNVGKSTVFNALTGLGVSTAHYPGTTRDVQFGTSAFEGRAFDVVDLPGAYSLHTDTEEGWVTRRALLDLRPDCVIVIADAGNLERNLPLCLEILDIGIPCVLATNLVDEALRGGIEIDEHVIASRLGIPVVKTVATQGRGLDILTGEALRHAERRVSPAPLYGPAQESAIQSITRSIIPTIALPYGLSPRAFAILALSGSEDFSVFSPEVEGLDDVLAVATDTAERIRKTDGEPVSVWLGRARSRLAAAITKDGSSEAPRKRGVDGWRLAASPTTGYPILLAVLAGIFLFLFFVGDLLAGGFATLWAGSVSPLLRGMVTGLLGDTAVARTLLWGLDSGIEASLAIGLPYILTFYVLLGILEDTGYLNAVAFLADRAMHRVGLHGHAVIPLVAAAGCNVPALLATRSLPDKRERLIASTLVAMVPCSARTAVVLGSVGHYIGLGPALGVLAVVFVVWSATGMGLNAVLPGRSTGLVLEMFPFRRPSLKGVLRKAWAQFKEFLFVATPIVVVGSVVLGGLYESGLLLSLSKPLSPVVVGWLGLPAVAGVTLLIGTLRKELALQLLVVMAVAVLGAGASDLSSFMTSTDLFVYALVNTLAVPCVSTIAVLAREHGWGRAAAVVGFTIIVGVASGGIAARVLG